MKSPKIQKVVSGKKELLQKLFLTLMTEFSSSILNYINENGDFRKNANSFPGGPSNEVYNVIFHAESLIPND